MNNKVAAYVMTHLQDLPGYSKLDNCSAHKMIANDLTWI